MALPKSKLRGHPAGKPTVDELLAGRERLTRASTDFLKIDLDTALTFANIARQSRDDSRKMRNRRSARKAYDTLAKFIHKVSLNATDDQTIRQGMNRLKAELQDLGETF